MEQFQYHGKSETPVAIIQNGTLPNQKSVTGTVSSIVGLAAVSGIGSPAIIIVGEVVNFAEELNGIAQEVLIQYQ